MEFVGYFIGVAGGIVGGWAGHMLWFKFVNRKKIVVIFDLQKMYEDGMFDFDVDGDVNIDEDTIIDKIIEERDNEDK